MKVTVETITPSVAESYLGMNKRNRRIKARHVYFLRDEIVDGRWSPNGASIVFSDDELLDGQHRLLAVIAAKKAIKSLVVRGVPREYFATIDSGAPRRPADMLSVNGEKNITILASACMWAMRIMRGTVGGTHSRTSSTDVEQWLEQNGGIRKSVEMCCKIKVMSAAVASAVHYISSKKDRTLADLFIDGILNGCKVDRDDPVYVFRERMIENAASKSKLHPEYQLALMTTAWNLLRKDQSAKSGIEYKPVFGSPERFPQIA